jgi:hypothetical protein
MNKRQKITKQLAKRAKARQNKIDPSSVAAPGAGKKRYISKAERAKLEAAAPAEQADAPQAEPAGE